MSKLTILKGLPGSGKTTLAKKMLLADGNLVRVNKDALREMLFAERPWSGKQEKFVIEVEREIVAKALSWNRGVIVDDTNLRANYWRDFGGDVETIDLTNVPLAECVERDRKRVGRACVGRGVIERMALEAGLIDLSQYAKIAIVDIDGTLANMQHRVKYLQETPKNYRDFYGTVSYDTTHRSVINAVKTLHATGHIIIVLSGRPTQAEGHINVGQLTDEWLSMYKVPNTHLFMRRAGDYRDDTDVKAELFSLMEVCGKLDSDAVKIVIDDRERVCQVWRDMQLPLLKVHNNHYVENRTDFPEALGIPKWEGPPPEDF